MFIREEYCEIDLWKMRLELIISVVLLYHKVAFLNFHFFPRHNPEICFYLVLRKINIDLTSHCCWIRTPNPLYFRECWIFFWWVETSINQIYNCFKIFVSRSINRFKSFSFLYWVGVTSWQTGTTNYLNFNVFTIFALISILNGKILPFDWAQSIS